jgi:serine phosphatase RsbU (regulator of sigma subunit)
MEPADEVGGDFYDVLSRPGEDLWLTIGDVSSHGLSSGLVMLMAQSSFATAWTTNPASSPDAILRHVNSTIYECVRNRMGDNKYITGLVFCHRGNGRFEYAGAHLWPLVYRAASGAVEQLDVDGAWLGLVADLPQHPVHEVTLDDGDVLCLYTDGIIETMNEEGEQYDMERFKESVRTTLAAEEGSLADATGRLLREVDAFSKERDDDRTILLIRRSPRGEG